jgi:hypothetical protein
MHQYLWLAFIQIKTKDFLKGLRKTKKNISQNSRFTAQDLNKIDLN